MAFYFFLTERNLLLLHLLHFILPCMIFMLLDLILVLQFLQTKIFLNFLASASGNFTIFASSYFLILSLIVLIMVSTFYLFHNFVAKHDPVQDAYSFRN